MALPIKSLDLSSRPKIHSRLTAYPPEISEHTFTNLFVWRRHRPVFFLEHGNSLIFLVAAETDPERFIMFGPPVGPMTITEAVAHLGDKLEGAIRLPAELMAEAEQAGLAPRPDRDNADYVYRVSDLAELVGRKYARKRNQVRQCLADFSCEHEPLTENLLPECMAMQDSWCEFRECEHQPGLCSEYKALRETFANFTELELIGGVIRVEGRVSAFAVAEKLSSDTAVWHFEKALAGIPGLGQLINHWFARYGLTDFEFVNREQDLGIAGLRRPNRAIIPIIWWKKSPPTPDQCTPRGRTGTSARSRPSETNVLITPSILKDYLSRAYPRAS